MCRGFLQKTLESDGSPGKYVVYVPASYEPSRSHAAILFLHGRGEQGDDGWKHVAVGLGPAVMQDAARWDFVVVFPQLPAGRASWGESEWLALGALDRAAEEYSIDATRVYLSGLSIGGNGVWTLGSRHAERFAAIAIVCGWGAPAAAAKLRDVPVWLFHGDADAVVPVSQCTRMADALRQAGGEPRVTIYPGVGHDAWTLAYAEPELPRWLLSHHRMARQTRRPPP